MFRILLAFLMIAEVAACPYQCAAADTIAQFAVGQVESSCSCCAEQEKSEEPTAPRDADTDCGCCACFCNGSANVTTIYTNTHDAYSIWIEVVDPAMMPSLASSAALDQAFPLPGEHSGRGMRLAVQSLLL